MAHVGCLQVKREIPFPDFVAVTRGGTAKNTDQVRVTNFRTTSVLQIKYNHPQSLISYRVYAVTKA
jgi:hypothetical protein